MNAPSTGRTVRCPRCGKNFGCDPAGDCWCKAIPPVKPVPDPGAVCLCPECLALEAREARA